ncbi:N-acetylmuramic acid 6-phosphate etherase [Alphaproteobacteria bacterium]|nr:N-acetylmuramic acid 6-phosphate etherase [Alphaproteobacteria bacterium]
MNKNIPKTELIFKKSKPLDHLSVSDGILLMVNEQRKAAIEVKKVSKSIEFAINQIYERLILTANGRLIYTGAGTSGRVGLQDGVELFPTFNWPKNRLDFIVAGGNKAIFNAVENAEDDVLEAKKNTSEKFINSEDVVIGLAASGNTPFTCKVLEESNKKGALTIAISNNPKGEILNFGQCKIILNTKEEVISGSTRLKAGTAQKICLNIISSMVMVKMGRVQKGKMSHMVPTNEKLRQRKLRINREL